MGDCRRELKEALNQCWQCEGGVRILYRLHTDTEDWTTTLEMIPVPFRPAQFSEFLRMVREQLESECSEVD